MFWTRKCRSCNKNQCFCQECIDFKQLAMFLPRMYRFQTEGRRPPLYVFQLPKFFELLLKVSYFFLSIHFGLQGLSKITFRGPWTYLTNNSHCKLRNLVALRGQKSKKNVPANPRSHANFRKKVPEGLKLRFDTLERKSSSRAFD